MKSVGIYYFSGTGNTLRVCNLIKEQLSGLGAEVKMMKVEDGLNEENSPLLFDAFAVAYPVHGFNAPQNVIDFVKQFPQGSKGYYIIKSSGEPAPANRDSSHQIVNILGKKGYELMDEFHYVMPYNMIFRHSQDMVDMMWKRAAEAAPYDAKEIFEGGRGEIRQKLRHKFISRLFTVEHGGMRIIGRGFKVDMEKCIKCGKCVKNCPVHNITFDGEKFTFGKKCLGCVRCSFNCPVNAIKISILEGWKVNGPYKIGEQKEYDESKVCRYCNKSYKQYFTRTGGNSIYSADKAE